MAKIIGLFPGQGSQYVGMGNALAEASATAKQLLDQADDLLGFSLSSIMKEGPEDEIKKTENTQPALFVVSQMVQAVLNENDIQLDYVAGHSLGEYSAIAAAGGLSFEDGLKLVRLRGELMAQAGVVKPGKMAAILGMDDEDLLKAVKQASESGIVVPANFNCPGQVVISGDVSGVDKAMEIISAEGKRVVELPVSGAFHSPLMEYAKDKLEAAIAETNFNELKVPLIANVNAEIVTDPAVIKESLVKQLVSPVKWTQCMTVAVDQGVDKGLEIGSGKVLMGLMRKISRVVKVSPVENLEAINKFKGN